MSIEIRSADLETDRDGLWRLKRQFELGLGTDTGGEQKAEIYEQKLTGEYRTRYLEWAERCTEEAAQSILVAERNATAGRTTDGGERLVGYIFVLPESLSLIWDAGVVNELFVAEPHRGTGVADRLMERALEVLSEQDLPLERVVLDVDRANDRAQAFYERYGFDHWGELVSRPLE
ncbi:GNAT family N-acetyltransferase [Halostagnicola sp. A-GB9-2]|uniref:GNAT family N-acetyltransferase n=1 Tax=Halostagnicola sp. A-GB9-2 TaxID=3048066 RepID=UPI0024C061E4|nr:GNAT family N-acetyltransferase [Halostagnicola sp. A-GB9-2]MDJ1431515.1 GNAT family N-acetyltransferase [Halostagnicola sp. A-GB9-2]